jgi:hypothetical protein
MSNDLPARCAQRQAHRHVLRASGAAHQQQRRQIAARDGQHERDDAEHHRRKRRQHAIQLRVDANGARCEHRNALPRILLRVLTGGLQVFPIAHVWLM